MAPPPSAGGAAASAALPAASPSPASSLHALPPVSGTVTDRAAHPLGILALFEEATTGLGPKLVAGGLSCMLISTLLNPMDVIKVRLQTQRQAALPRYRGFLHAFRTILSEEGYRRGLMRGFTPSLMREASYSSVRMGTYDAFKILFCGRGSSAGKDDFTLLQKIASGCCSGALGSLVASPTDLVKIRFQSFDATPANANPYPHSWAAFADIYRRGGVVHGLWAGATPTILRAAMLTGSQLASYDHSKRLLLRSTLFRFEDTPSTHLLASFISGLVTCTVVNPVDVVKTRIMSDSAERALYGGSPLRCLALTVRQEGLAALLKGWVPNYMRLGPHFILSLPLAEWIRRQLGAESM